MLALNNRNSIRRVPANGWLREHAGANEDLLWDSDEAVYRLQSAVSSEPDVETLKAVLHACLPDRQPTSSREDEIVVQFLDRLARAGLSDCAAGAASVWRTPAGKELASEARAGLADSIARQTEASCVVAVRSAAESTGWSTMSPVGSSGSTRMASERDIARVEYEKLVTTHHQRLSALRELEHEVEKLRGEIRGLEDAWNFGPALLSGEPLFSHETQSGQ